MPRKDEDQDAVPAAEEAVEDAPAWEGTISSMVPIVAPDGHVNLSQEDIDARDKG